MIVASWIAIAIFAMMAVLSAFVSVASAFVAGIDVERGDRDENSFVECFLLPCALSFASIFSSAVTVAWIAFII